MPPEDKEALSCLEGLKLLCKPQNIDKLVKTIQLDTNQTFLEALKSGSLMYLIQKTKVWCTVVQEINNKTCLLLYDNHLLLKIPPYKFIVLGPSGELIKHSHKFETNVRWSVPRRFNKWICQSSIFNKETEQDVKFDSTQQVLDFIKQTNTEEQIQINYVHTIYPNVRISVIKKPSKFENCTLNLCLYFFRGKLYCTPFDTCWVDKPGDADTCLRFYRKKTLEKNKRIQQECQKSVPSVDKSLMISKNKSCSINIMLKGTVLAYHCGLFDNLCEWKKVCLELNKTVIFLWPHHDCNQELRSLFAYCPSNDASYFGTFNVRQHYQQSTRDVLQYKSLWAFLLHQHEEMKIKKQTLLSNIFKKLVLQQQTDSTTNVPKNDGADDQTKPLSQIHMLTRCFRELQHLCNNQRMVYFQREDIFLHKFKLLFANFINTNFDSKFKIEIVADRNNIPHSIRSKPFDLENLRANLTANEPFIFCPFDDTEDLLKLIDKNKITTLANILPCPLISGDNWHDFKWESVYCPGQVGNPKELTFSHVSKRSHQLTKLLVDIYLDYSCWLADEFGLDSMNNRQTFNQLSYQCIIKKAIQIGGPLYQSPEKLKPYYDCLLRSFCHGGFCFSAKTQINSGDKMFPHVVDSPNVANIVELDVNSSYGAAASAAGKFPGGFCMAYFNNSTHPTHTFSTDSYKRFKSFEFTTVYAIIHYYQQLPHVAIRTTFHNFAPLQLFKIGPYIVDLVLVLECLKTNKILEIALFQLDGQFAHGCDTCPPLRSYIGGKSLSELRFNTNKRDVYIQSVLSQYGLPFSYQIINSCHDSNFSHSKVKHYWNSTSDLKQLSAGYTWLPSEHLELQQLKNIPPELTFQIICQGRIQHTNETIAQLAINSLEGILPCPQNVAGSTFHSFENQTCQDTLFTQEWFNFITEHLKFQVTHVTAIFIFKTCHIFPYIYKQLIDKRLEAKEMQHMELKADMYKKLINVSCGYFGLNLNKQKILQSKVFIINSLNKKIKILKHKFEPLGCINNNEYFLKSLPNNNTNRLWQKNKTHAAIYIHIVEQGKLQLYKKLLLILSMCQPYSVRLLYSNIDNLVLALATNKTDFAPILRPEYAQEYRDKIKTHLMGNEPGKLKLEWSLDGFLDWSFITPRQCIYVVDKANITKFSSINKEKINNQTLFKLAQNMLENKSSTIVQTRRTMKMFNLDKTTINLQI